MTWERPEPADFAVVRDKCYEKKELHWHSSQLALTRPGSDVQAESHRTQ